MLVDRTIELTRRHAGFYSGLTLIAIAVQAGFAYFFREPAGIAIAGSIVLPFVVTAVNIQTALDIRGGAISRRELLDWTLSRVWAVIIIDLAIAFPFGSGVWLIAFSGTLEDVLTGLLTIVLCTTLLLADVFASVEPSPGPIKTLPFAVVRSIMLAWQNGNIVRLLFIAVLQATSILLAATIEKYLVLQHVPGATFLTDVALGTLLAAPFSVLTTVIYFDCLAREREAEA